MSKTLVSILAVCLLLGLAAEMATAQCTPPSQRTWVALNDNTTPTANRDTLWFGHAADATYGLNTLLCEIELPPIPPGGIFDVRFVNIPGRAGLDTPAGLGQGFKQDYRAFVSATHIDTHRVSLRAGDGGYPFTLRWNPAGVLAMCDSAIIQDEFGGIIVKARMHVVDNVIVALDAVNSLFLIRYGQKVTSVNPIGNDVPTTFGLSQNYPNPFNPSTTVRFDVARAAKTDVGVYDILGRKVATLVSGQLAPGTYGVEWNGTNNAGVRVGSGVYLLRMDAVDENNIAFSSVRKLVLTK